MHKLITVHLRNKIESRTIVMSTANKYIDDSKFNIK